MLQQCVLCVTNGKTIMPKRADHCHAAAFPGSFALFGTRATLGSQTFFFVIAGDDSAVANSAEFELSLEVSAKCATHPDEWSD